MDRLEPRIAGLLIHRSGLSQYSYPPGMIRIAACQKEKKKREEKERKTQKWWCGGSDNCV